MGPAVDRAHLQQVLAELDRPVASMAVHLAVYEIDTSSSDQSAINLVGHVLGQVASIGGTAAAALSTAGTAALTLKVGSFSAVLAALDSSSDAHLVTAPVLRTSSGVMSSFAVGDSVPTVGSVSYEQGSSTPVQSIQYQQSGVVFSVVPEVVGGKVDVALYQSISSFVPTTVGVTSSPTLQNRVLSSDIILAPGATVVLGGLMQTSDTKGTAGWWLLPKLSHDNEKSKTELVLVLSVDVDAP
jgi:type II secretory pathway component GspD/PulD (secretin)